MGFVESKPKNGDTWGNSVLRNSLHLFHQGIVDRFVVLYLDMVRHIDGKAFSVHTVHVCYSTPHQRMHRSYIVRLLMILSFGGVALGYTRPYYLQRQDLFGIWKLSHPHFKLPSSSQDPQGSSSKAEGNDEVVLRLNEDGSFDPYTPC